MSRRTRSRLKQIKLQTQSQTVDPLDDLYSADWTRDFHTEPDLSHVVVWMQGYLALLFTVIVIICWIGVK